MPNTRRVYHVDRKFWPKLSRVLWAVEQCAWGWVDKEMTQVRTLTPAEAIAARNKQAEMREPLPFAEQPGLVFRPSESGQAATRAGYDLVREANQFAVCATR